MGGLTSSDGPTLGADVTPAATNANATAPYSAGSGAPSADGNVTGNGNDTGNGNTTGNANMFAPSPGPTPNTPFVSIFNDSNGEAQLLRNGARFYMLGYQGEVPDVSNYCSWTGSDMNTAFSAMRTASGANTVRLWFLQSAGGPGNWTAFDKAIAAAKADNLEIVATLVNQWGDCEPYVNNVKNYKTVQWYQTGYKQTDDGYALSFRDFAQAVATHYANEPTIAFWQLVNESEARDPVSGACPSESAAANAIRAFADDMATVLHTADPNHLVNLGTQDNGYCGVSGNDYQYVQAGKVDLCETHSYEPGNVAMPALVAQNISLCHAINKPIFMGETGICRNVQADGSCSGNADATTLQRRAGFFRQKMQAGANAGSSGMLVWQYSPDQSDVTFGVYADDPLDAVMLNP